MPIHVAVPKSDCFHWLIQTFAPHALVCLALAAPAGGSAAQSVDPGGTRTNWAVRRFLPVDTLLANPGQGWMSQSRRPSASPRFPCSVAYIRFNWADVEPEQGKYNWSVIDDVITAWAPQHAAVALRVMTCNAHSGGYYSSPKWLFDAGCKGYEYVRGGDDPTSGGKRIPRIEPDYADPVYLARHGEFLQALGERYDGHSSIEFLDIGSYGIWGEWHTSHPAPLEVRRQIVDVYRHAFPRTPLVFMSDDAHVLQYALAHGTGFRRDGVGSPWHEQNWIGSRKYADVPELADAWRHAPVVFEWFGDYEYLRSKEWSFDAAVQFMLNNHVSLINDNIGRVPPEAMPQLLKLARLAGARFVLRELAHEQTAAAGSAVKLQMKWANVGVGGLYREYVLRCALVNASGKISAEAILETDPRQWMPGEHDVAAKLALPADLVPGAYTLRLGMMDPAGRRRPFLLAIDAPEDGGWYSVSHLDIR